MKREFKCCYGNTNDPRLDTDLISCSAHDNNNALIGVLYFANDVYSIKNKDIGYALNYFGLVSVSVHSYANILNICS